MSPGGGGRTTLVTGVAGQDGVLLARELVRRGHRVVGTVEPGELVAAQGSPYLALDGLHLVEHDLRDTEGLARLLASERPSGVVNLAALSSVGASWADPGTVLEVNGAAVLRLLEALRAHRDATGDDVRLVQASTAEVHGSTTGLGPQGADADAPHRPRNPYALAKSLAHQAVVTWREAYALDACNVVLHNHESVLRPPRFVTRKITRAAAEIALGEREVLELGPLVVHRDWGAAEDTVRAMALVLEADEPRDYVVATGIARPLSDWLVTAFAAAGLGDPAPWVRQDPALVRPTDADQQVGDASRLRAELGWAPERTFDAVVRRMVEVDLERVRTGVEEDVRYLAW